MSVRRPRHRALTAVAVSLALAPLGLAFAVGGGSAAAATPGPCDLYAAGGTPCVAAHSTTRALYAAYTGPLYQVRRASDGTTRKIGPVAAGRYANAAAQDTFCADTNCEITAIYDQSPKGNTLTRAPKGGWSGPRPDGTDNLADAAAAPVTLGGHKVYGVFVAPGTGYRDDTTKGIATGDDPEGIYAVLDGTHYSDGCCFDYGNAETTNTADGAGTMEALYFGDNTQWGSGRGLGPWVMADLEDGLFSGVHTYVNSANPGIRSRFTTAFLKGGHDQWALRGGDAQTGSMDTWYTGARPNEKAGYNPMTKQGGIVLGIGGDNSPWGAGTFYEGVMTSGYPSESTENAVQADVTAQGYGTVPVPLQPGKRLSLRTTTTPTAYVEHDHADEAVSVARLTSSSPAADRGRATFVQTAGLADPGCVSFEAADEPGSYLRHQDFILRIQQDDGSSQYQQDATFCPTSGNSGTGTSYRSVNFTDHYLRAYQGAMYLASNGGDHAWDTTTNWAADSSFVTAKPLS